MSTSALNPRLAGPWFASAVLHLLLLASFVFGTSIYRANPVPLPLGQAPDRYTTVIEFEAQPVPPSRKPLVTAASDTDVSVPEPKRSVRSPRPKVRPPQDATTPPVAGNTATSGAPTAGTSSGVGDPDGSATSTPLSEYLFALRQLIEDRKVYPAASRKLGETGKVVVAVEVLRDGTLGEVKLQRGSAHARLDQAAIETVAGVEKFRPLPDTVTQDRLEVQVPIEFVL